MSTPTVNLAAVLMIFRCVLLLTLGLAWSAGSVAATQPNIVWITSEDNGPHMGCYGDRLARTPNLDALASRGVLYRNAWSTVPVCAPARTAIITGMYPSSLGAQHMRSMATLPEHVKLYPEYLRSAGYYCTNNAKEDYSVPAGSNAWDESSRKAHWKNRASDQPFFAVFNIFVTHESQIRSRPHQAVHDPDAMELPSYYPDAPESRQDWAQYYDKMTQMDAMVGARLKELKDAGLMEDTIVMYYGDHGVGLPRAKRSACNSGLQVPFIVYVPEKYRHLMPDGLRPGDDSDRLVSFVDLAPTLLKLAGIEIPAHMQGKPFLGAKQLPEKDYLYGLRGRMDERVDMVRTVRDKRYVYVRNYLPHRAHMQHVAYQFETPTTQVWHAAYEAGTLPSESAYFFGRRDSERLYDLKVDPDEMHSLVNSQEHTHVLTRMRAALDRIQLETRDVGFIPEPDLLTLYADDVPRDLALDDERYPLAMIRDVALQASSESFDSELVSLLKHNHPAVRYWAATGLLIHDEYTPELLPLLDDVSVAVRIVAAEIVARFANEPERQRALQVLLELSNVNEHHVLVATSALNAIDYLDEDAATIADEVAELRVDGDNVPPRNRKYIIDLKAKTIDDLE